MIFMTSNLGAHEMNTILRPTLGFHAHDAERRRVEGLMEEGEGGKMARAATEAARRKFTPEFMNRIDKVMVFQPLGAVELDKILTLELNVLQQRIFNSAATTPFVFSLTAPAREFVLREGTDMKYGARHLKRAIERELVHPLSNLVASQQIRSGDLIKIDYDMATSQLNFIKEAEDMPAYAMVELIDNRAGAATAAAAAAAPVPPQQAVNAKSSRR
jgi:ATP-dependent Clp protease ATP-binding subunit ClpA